MNAKLKKIDERGEILANDLKHGRISFEVWAEKHKKLIDRAEAILKGRA